MKHNTKVRWFSGLLMVMLCCAVYAASLSFRTMPISEGWYTEYAWQINNGNLPYRDFQYLFFPLYIHIIALFTKVFGYSIFALRVLGVVAFVAIGVSLYLVFAKLFDTFSAMVGAITASLFLQSEVTQIFYDYIRFHDLFAIIATYMLVIATQKCTEEPAADSSEPVVLFQRACVPVVLLWAGITGLIRYPFAESQKITLACMVLILAAIIKLLVDLAVLRRKNIQQKSGNNGDLSAILCGIFVSAECMVKQSNGMIMIAYVIVFFIFCAIFLRRNRFWGALQGVISGIAFSFGLMLVYLFQTKSFEQFVQCCFKSALAAKGGLLAVLFNWIRYSVLNYLPRVYITVLILLVIGFSIHRYTTRGLQEVKTLPSWLILTVGFAFTLVCWSCTWSLAAATAGKRYFNIFLHMPTFFTSALLFACFGLYILWVYIQKREIPNFVHELIPCFPVLGVIFAQGYGSGMSGGLAISQTAIGMGFLVAVCVHVALRARFKSFAAISVVIAMCLTFTFSGKKSYAPYEWYNLQQGLLIEHTEPVDVPLLSGIRVRPVDKHNYEGIYHDIISHSTEDDTLFTFPHCPIFYTLSGRHSDTYTKVQWFDVSSSDAILSDIDKLRTAPPKMLVYVTMPEVVYDGHEYLFTTHQTRHMRDFIVNELIPMNGYELLHSYDFGDGYIVSTYSR